MPVDVVRPCAPVRVGIYFPNGVQGEFRVASVKVVYEAERVILV